MRMTKALLRSSAWSLAIISLGLSGCRRADAHRQSGMIQVDIETSPQSTDPRFATDIYSSRVNELVFDSLVRVDSHGQFVGHLAESFERRGDQQIVFHMRRGIHFSDGREVTARDVKFTFDSILDPANASPKRGALRHIKSVEAPDDYTVVMTTDGRYAPALESARQEIVQAGTPPPAKSGSIAPLGAGPFRMISFHRDESVVLDRNPFHSALPQSPRTILFKVVPDPTVRALELTEGVCDFSENNIQPEVLPYLAAQQNLRIIKSAGTSYRYLAFNFSDPRLRDIRVRRAIAYAIDRNAIVGSLMLGTARVASGLLSPGNWAYEPNVTTYPYDLSKSRELLEEAGYAAGPGGMRNLRFVYKTTPEQLRFATALQAMLRQAGIELDIRTNEFATFYSDVQRGNFDLMSLQWVGFTEPNQYYATFDSNMMPPRGYNRGHYSNPDMDRLLEEGQTTFDITARRKIYARVQEIAADDLPYVSLWWDDIVVVMNRDLSGFEPTPSGSLASLATIRIAPEPTN
jgi:peptide/nickel transport system substrate-binding protein